MRRVGWIVPAALAALALAMIASIVIARRQKPTEALQIAAPGILKAGAGEPPEIAALNAQLAEIAALRAGASFGSGLEKVVRNPVASLRASLGEEWRELGRRSGHVFVRPTGARSPHVEIGMAAVARHGPAELVVITSAGQRVSRLVATGAFQLVNLGPLVAPKGSGIRLELQTFKPGSNAAGPSLVLSPIQGEYLAAGQWATGMAALRQPGPAGLRGVFIASGTRTRFAMAPGVAGRCIVALRAAAVGRVMRVTVDVGRESRSALVGREPSVIYFGPFVHATSVVSVSAGKAVGEASLFLSDMRLIPAPSGRR